MSLAAQIAQAAQIEIEAPPGSGVHWRVRRVVSADLAKVQVAALRMVYPSAKADSEGDSDAQIKALSRMGERDIDHVARLQGGVVCAGTVAVRVGSGEWEPVQICMDEPARDKAGGLDGGCMALTDLPAGVETAIYSAISNLHGDAKEAAERLARFRGGA